jgi:hypothetical protein
MKIRNFGSGAWSWSRILLLLEMVKKKLSILVIMKTQMGWNLELFKFF